MNKRSLVGGILLLPVAVQAQFFDFANGQGTGSFNVTDISSDGQNIVGYKEGADTKAWRFRLGSSIQFLEALNPGAGSYSRAYSISGNGVIVGGDSTGFRSQTKWDAMGTPSLYDNYFTSSIIMGLSTDGGIAAAQVGPGAYRVVGNTYTKLPTTGLPYNALFITGMAGDGSKIVAINQLVNGIAPDKVALWRDGIGSVVLPGAGGAPKISRDGTTIVTGDLVFDATTLVSSTLNGLPTSNSVTGSAITTTGSFIGGLTRDSNSGLNLATLWDSQRNPILLKDFLIGKGINANSYDMDKITAIEENNGELTISGTYRSGFTFRPFAVHVVPEPISMIALVTGLAGILMRKRKK